MSLKIFLDKDNSFRADVASRLQKHYAFKQELARQLEIDEAALPSYERPLKVMKKTKNPFTAVTAYAFAKNIVKSVMP